MQMNFADFKNKEIIDVCSGARVGFVDDMIFDSENHIIESVVIFGRLRFFGLFGRGESTLIDFCDIKVIGTDTILIDACNLKQPTKSKKITFFDKLFG